MCLDGQRENPCVDICHPGPCKPIVCPGVCAGLPAPAPGPWARLRKRFRDRNRGAFGAFLGLLVIVLFVHGLFGAYVHMHIRWNAMPYVYQDFQDKFGTTEFMLLLMSGVLFLIPAHAALTGAFAHSTRQILNYAFNVPQDRKGFRRFLTFTMAAILFLFLNIWPIVG